MDERAERALRKWQERLNLSNWRLELEVCPYLEGDHDGLLLVPVHDGYRAKIQLAERVLSDSDPRYVEEVVLHELIHLLLEDLWDFVIREVKDTEWAHRLLERAVQELVRALMGMESVREHPGSLNGGAYRIPVRAGSS